MDINTVMGMYITQEKRKNPSVCEFADGERHQMGGISEKQLYEAFGLGEQVQEVAEPAADTSLETSAQGAQEQEVAEPAQQEDIQNDTAVPAAQEDVQQDADTDEPDEQADKVQLTPKQRRENAARRRQQEQQAAINQAVETALKAEREKHAAEISDIFAKAQVKNTITGERITSKEGFDKWYQQFSENKIQRDLKDGKLTKETLDQMISEHPVVKQAQTVIASQEQEQRRQQAENDRAMIAEELAKIAERDPSIKSVADLLKMPEAKEFREKVNRGYSFDDAHAIVTRARLEGQRIEAAKQQALNNARGKEHLRSTTAARGTGNISVPQDVMARFRQFNPDATPAEIQEYYNKYHKN